MKNRNSLIVLIGFLLVLTACGKTANDAESGIAALADGYVGSEANVVRSPTEDVGAYEPEEATSTYEWEADDAEDIAFTDLKTTFSYNVQVNPGYSSMAQAAMGGVTANDADAVSTSSTTKQKKIRKTNDKIIRKGNVGIQLKDYNKDKHPFYDAIRKFDGYISKENERNETARISNELEIRVPNENFDKMMAAITTGDGIKNIDYKRISAIDVGEEFYDLQTRIRTKKEVELRYIAILRKANKIKDILAVEDQIRVIREEIESKEGRLRFLSDRISYSTINLYLYENLEYDAPLSKKPTFWGKLLNASASGWNIILNFLLFLTYIWPILVLFTLAIVLYKKKLFIFKKRDQE